jgi:hypothetical protein
MNPTEVFTPTLNWIRLPIQTQLCDCDDTATVLKHHCKCRELSTCLVYGGGEMVLGERATVELLELLSDCAS